MRKNIEEIYNQLPSRWAELKFRDFKKILELPISEDDEFNGLFNGQDNSIKMLSVLSDVPVEELYNMELATVTALTTKIAFVVDEPDPKSLKSSLKWKTIEQVSYGDYITFVMLSQEPFKNLGLLIKSFSSVELSNDQIEDLSMLEVYAAFFTLQKYVAKFMNNMVRRTAVRVVTLTARERILIPFKQNLARLKQRFKKHSGGISQ